MKKLTKTSLLLAIFIFIYILPTRVFASEMFFGPNGAIYIYSGSTYYVQVDGNHNNLPKAIYGLAANVTLDLGTISMYFSPASGNVSVLDNFNYNYLIFDYCSTTNVSIIITNSSCGNSCVASGTFNAVSLGTSCTTGSYTGTRYLVQVPIQKWYLNTVSEMLEVDSFIKFKNNNTWSSPVTVNQVFLSDEDYIVTYRNQQELINKLNSVQTAITNMQNSINSNTNTNAQNIINNQNANAAQAHNDAQATQSAIGDVEDAVKDDTVNSNTGKSFFDNFSDNTHGLSGIIAAPLNMINGLVNVSSTSCNDLTGTYQNTTFTVPCGKLLWGHTGVSQFNEFYNLVVGGALCYWIIRDLFLTIEALKDPDNDKVEVMSL